MKFNSKQRMQLWKPDGEALPTHIRCIGGHSMAGLRHDMILRPLSRGETPAEVFHGTFHVKLHRIQHEGLLPGGPNAARSHVMMSPYHQKDPRCVSGMRFNCEILVVLDAKLMYDEGLRLAETSEHALCCDQPIPTRYFKRIETTSDGAILFERPLKSDGTPDLPSIETELRRRAEGRPGSSGDDLGGAGGKPLPRNEEVIERTQEDEEEQQPGPQLVLKERPNLPTFEEWKAQQEAEKSAWEWKEDWWNSTEEERQQWKNQGWTERSWKAKSPSWVPKSMPPRPESWDDEPVCPACKSTMLKGTRFCFACGECIRRDELTMADIEAMNPILRQFDRRFQLRTPTHYTGRWPKSDAGLERKWEKEARKRALQMG